MLNIQKGQGRLRLQTRVRLHKYEFSEVQLTTFVIITSRIQSAVKSNTRFPWARVSMLH